jgi:hypothetical protein
MKLNSQSSNHTYIGTKWERKINSWKIELEETDFDETIRNRFSAVEVDQTQLQDRRIITSFRGSRTNWFGFETKDKQKRLIIDSVTKFIQNNTNALVAQWSEQSAHN